MINDIEIAKSGRAECSFCRKIIGKGTPRGIEDVKKSTYTGSKYYCHKCTLILIDEQMINLKKLKKDFKKLIKQNQKALILEKFKNGI